MKRFLCATLILFASGATLAQEPGRVLLWIIEQQAKARFSGSRTTEMIVNGEKTRITEYVWRDGFNARTEYPENSFRKGFIIVEHRNERLEYDPHLNEIRRSRGERGYAFLFERLRQAFQNGDLRLKQFNADDIAGRKAYGLAVIDRDGNVAQKYWIDWEKGVVLKAIQFGKGGEERGKAEFTRINFSPDFPAGAWEINRAGARIVDVGPPNNLPWHPLEPTWLPPGFRETERNVRQIGPNPVLLIHYSDGRKHISVFQSVGRREDALPPKPPRGGPNLLSARIGDVWVAVMGDVDVDTLDRILNSLRPSDD